MSKSSPKTAPSVRKKARDAIDRKKAKDVLASADGDIEPDDDAATALKEAAAEETAEIARSAARHARRRGKSKVTGEDVARANERHQRREERGRRR